MRVGKGVSAVAFATVVCAHAGARADEEGSCSKRISRANVVPCAISASALVRAEREGVQAIRGREKTASALLPSNPTASFSGARRTTSQLDATNWYGTLSQEVELGGQRRARKRASSHERDAQERVMASAERRVAADALRAYFEVLAAQDLLRLTEHMEQTFASATVAAQAAAERGASAGLEADLVEVAGIRLTQARIEAQRQFRSASAGLSTLMGLDPAVHRVDAEGELAPLPAADALAAKLADQAVARRPEIAAAEAARASFEEWSRAYRRSRVPNPTFSVMAQSDGFSERVVGAGVSIPITLPAPLGRDYSGHIAENLALARRSGALREQAERDVRLEVFTAGEALTAARAERDLFTDERVARAEQTLRSIAGEIAAGRLAISTVIVAQQGLIEFLHQHVRAKLAMCIASVDVAYAAGLPLDGGAP